PIPTVGTCCSITIRSRLGLITVSPIRTSAHNLFPPLTGPACADVRIRRWKACEYLGELLDLVAAGRTARTFFRMNNDGVGVVGLKQVRDLPLRDWAAATVIDPDAGSTKR